MSRFLQFFERLKELGDRPDREFILSDNYTIVVITIPDNGTECLNISSKTEDTITINALNKCDETSGTENLNLVIKTAWKVGYKNIELIDASKMTRTFPNKMKVDISIKKLNILATGYTWYEASFGFANDAVTKKQEMITEFINLPSNQLLERLNGLPKRTFERDLIKFNEFNGIEPGDKSMSIIEIFNKIKQEFRTDPRDDSNVNKYGFYARFVVKCYELLLMDRNIQLMEDDMTYFTLLNPILVQGPRKGGSRRKKRTKGTKGTKGTKKNKRKSSKRSSGSKKSIRSKKNDD